MYSYYTEWAFQMAPEVKNLPANAGDIRDMGSIPGSGRCLAGRNGQRGLTYMGSQELDPIEQLNHCHRYNEWDASYGRLLFSE